MPGWRLSWLIIAGVALVGSATAQSANPQAGKRQDSAAAPRQTPAEAGAVSSSILSLPFKKSWVYLSDKALPLPPAVAGSKVFLPLYGGEVVCLDLVSGSLLWSSDSGGAINTPVSVVSGGGATVIYVATDRITKQAGSSGGSLRALDGATGLTLWVRDYPRPFCSAIVAAAGELYAGSADGFMYAISAIDGRVLWRAQTQGQVHSTALVTPSAIYFGSDDGALRAVDPVTGKEQLKFQSQGRIVGRPVVVGGRIYFGSADGWVYALALDGLRLKWKSRTGAAVEASPSVDGARLIVGSFDDFVYALSLSTGDRVWKRRFDNRIVSGPLVSGDATMIAPYRSDHVPVLSVADGRRLNYFQLEKGFELVSEPVLTGRTLLVPTDKGLVAAEAVSASHSDSGSKPRTGSLQPDRGPQP